MSRQIMRTGTKIAKAPRGRPRSFDEGEVLDCVRAVFLEKGFSGASLDDLAAAASLNRPSLYAAFGDKEQLYIRALKRYGEISIAGMDAILGRNAPIGERLGQVYKAAVAMYTSPPHALGCMIVNTAAVEAPGRPKIAKAASELLVKIQSSFERAFQRAVDDGEIAATPLPAVRAVLAGAMFDTLAVRARLGESASSLRAFALSMVPSICR